MRNKKNDFKHGFTLIELVIVIAIIAIMALILVPTLDRYKEESTKVKEQASVRTLYTEALLLNSQFSNSIDPVVREKSIEDAFRARGVTDVTVTINDSGTITSIKYVGEVTEYEFNGRFMKETDSR